MPSSTRLSKTLVGPFVIGFEEVLAERVVGVAVPHQDALQLGVPGEPDAHHVVDLALLEVGPLPDRDDRGDLALALGLGRPDPELDQRAGVVGRVELVVDLDAVLVVDALEAGEVVVPDRVLVAEVEADRDELLGLDEQAGLDDRRRPGAELGVEPVGQFLEPGVAEPDEAGPGLGLLDLLGGLGLGGVGLGGGRRRTASGSGWKAGILAGLARSASRASTSPCAVRSAVISTSRRSIRSGPRTGMATSRSTSVYQGVVPFGRSRGCRASRRRSSSGA